MAAVEGVQHRVDLAGGGGQPGDQLLGRETQQPRDRLAGGGQARPPSRPGGRRRPASRSVPSPRPAPGPAPRPGPRTARAAVPSSVRPERLAQAGQAAVRCRAQIWRACSIASTRPTRCAPSGATPSTCRPSRIWASLTSHSQPSTCSRKSSNSVSWGRDSRPRSWSSLAAWISVQIWARMAGQLGRVQRGHGGVLVQQLLQPGQVAVGLGAGHRRHQVIDDRGVRAALGLRALARVVDQERVDQRQVAQRRVGPARGRHAEVLARQPLQVAVLAHVHDGVRAEALLQPAVGGQVVVARRQLRVVVDRDGFSPNPRGGWTSSTTLPARSAASTMSPSALADRSTYSSPGGGPQAFSIAARSSAGRRPNQPRYCAAGMRTAAVASCWSVSQSGSWPPAAMTAWISASPSGGSTPGSASGPRTGPMS